MNGLTVDVVLVVGGEVVVGRAGWMWLVRSGAIVLRFSAVDAVAGDGHCDVVLGSLQLSLLVMVAAV